MRMIIDGSCDIRYRCLNSRFEANEVVYNIEWKNKDFESQVERHKERNKLEEGVEWSSSTNEKLHRWLV